MTAVFIDSNLNTHLAMLLSPSDTVADLKGKISIEHALCFPDVGEISVQSLKAKRKGSFYHLCDSMLVQSAFSGIKGTWFLHMDAVSAVHLAETTNEMRNMGPTALPEMPKLPAGRSANNDSVSGDANVDASHPVNSRAKVLRDEHFMPATELAENSDPEEPERQVPVNASNIRVDINIQPAPGHVISEVEKDAGLNDFGNVVVKGNNQIVSNNKEKSRKRTSAACIDQLVDKGCFLVENKKHKKGKDGRSEEPVEVTIAGSCIPNKEVDILESVHVERIIAQQDDPPQKDLSVDGKKKKKKKKKGAVTKNQSDIQSAIPESWPIDTHYALLVENQEAEHKSLAEETDVPCLPDKATREVTGKDSLELGSMDLLPLNHKGTRCNGTINNAELSTQEPQDEYTKQGHLSDADPQGTLADINTDFIKEDDAVVTLQEAAPQRHLAIEGSEVPHIPHRIKKKHKTGTAEDKHALLNCNGDRVNKDNLEALENTGKDLRKKSNVLSNMLEAGDIINHGEGKEASSDPNVKASQHRRKKSHKNKSHNPQPANTDEALPSPENEMAGNCLKKPPVDQLKYSHKESRDSTVAANIAVRGADDSEVVSNRNDQKPRRSRKKSTKAELPNHDSTLESVYREQTGKSKPATVVAEAENLAFEDPTVPPNPNGRNSRHKNKKSAELTKHDLIDKEPIDNIDSLVKKDSEKSHLIALQDNHPNEQSKEANSATFSEEAPTRGSPRKTNLVNVSDRNDSPEKKRKSGPDFSEYLPSNHDLDNSAGSRSPPENFEKSPGTTHRDSGNDSNNGTHDETIRNLVQESHVDTSLSGLAIDSSKMQDFVQHSLTSIVEGNTEGLLGNYHEISGSQSTPKERAAESSEASGIMELPKSNTERINFLEYFVPKAAGLEAHALTQEHTMESESRKVIGEKTKRRKRKANMHSEDPTHNLVNPSSLDGLEKKPQDDDHGKHDAVKPLVPILDKVPKTKRVYKKKAGERISDFDTSVEQNPQDLNSDTHIKVSLSKNDENNILEGKVPEVSLSKNDENNNLEGKVPEVSLSKNDENNNLEGKVHAVPKKKLKSIPSHENHATLDATAGDQQPMNSNASVRSSPVAKPASHNYSSAGAKVSLKKNLPASSDSTKENTPSRKYRVSVRKAPNSKFGNNLRDGGQGKTRVVTPGSIFDDATSESSDDGFEVYNRKSTTKPISGYSSASEGSDMGLSEAQKGIYSKTHAYMNTPGTPAVEKEEPDEIILSQTTVKSRLPLSKILRTTSSYRKAKISSSQSQPEDGESQPDVVLESQLD